MFVLGLTGSIATGKSTALAAFKAAGARVFSADAAVHALYEGQAAKSIEALFPGTTNNGRVERAALSARTLGHPERLAALEALIHPLVHSQLAAFVQHAAAAGAGLVVLDVPLLFETGFDYGLDAVAVTTCTRDEQRRRALGRPAMTPEKLESILTRQLSQAEKASLADFVIDTNGTIAQTRQQVATLAAQLVTKARKDRHP